MLDISFFNTTLLSLHHNTYQNKYYRIHLDKTDETDSEWRRIMKRKNLLKSGALLTLLFVLALNVAPVSAATADDVTPHGTLEDIEERSL